MEKQQHSVLIIDDHPLISSAYKAAFNFYSEQNDSVIFTIQIAQDCDNAIKLINEYHEKEKNIDLVFLDIKLPASSNGDILSGEDLGIKLKLIFPKVKIIVATTLNNNYRIHSIFKNLDPDGFLIKNDITSKELIEAINTVLNAPPYYSKTVIQLLRKQVANNFILDDIDRKILYELSIGTRMKEIYEILPLSKAAIEKRKRHIKVIFEINSTDNRELLLKAKEKGYI